MSSPLKIIFASNNENKFSEIKSLLSTRIILKDSYFLRPKDLGIHFEALEDGITFEQNAKIKASELFKAIKKNNININNLIVIADDSGLCVRALEFMPGVHSARFANMESENNSTDEENRDKLKKELEMRGLWGSKAYFECSISCIFNDENKIYSGQTHGYVSIRESGNNGFGYDSMFYLDEVLDESYFSDFSKIDYLKKSISLLTLDEKNKISHRGRAISKLINDLEKCAFKN